LKSEEQGKHELVDKRVSSLWTGLYLAKALGKKRFQKGSPRVENAAQQEEIAKKTQEIPFAGERVGWVERKKERQKEKKPVRRVFP